MARVGRRIGAALAGVLALVATRELSAQTAEPSASAAPAAPEDAGPPPAEPPPAPVAPVTPTDPKNLAPWTVLYRETGGIDGSVWGLRLSSTGRVTSSDAPVPIDGVAAPARVAAIAALVARMKDDGDLTRAATWADPCAHMRRCVAVSLAVTYDGRTGPVDPTGAAAAIPMRIALREIYEDASERAAAAAWQRARPLRTDRVLRVHREMRDAEGVPTGSLDGTWTRRGGGDSFDVVWDGGKRPAEVVDVRSITRRRLDVRGDAVLVGRASHERYDAEVALAAPGFTTLAIEGGTVTGGSDRAPIHGTWQAQASCATDRDCREGLTCCPSRAGSPCVPPWQCEVRGSPIDRR